MLQFGEDRGLKAFVLSIIAAFCGLPAYAVKLCMKQDSSCVTNGLSVVTANDTPASGIKCNITSPWPTSDSQTGTSQPLTKRYFCGGTKVAEVSAGTCTYGSCRCGGSASFGGTDYGYWGS